MIVPPTVRHELVYCSPNRLGQHRILTDRAEDIPVIENWISLRRPLIARMRRADDPTDHVSLGLPLPLAYGKRRIALSAPLSLLELVRPPPELQSAIHLLSLNWRERIAELCANLNGVSRAVGVVGSLAWQHLTGETYLHPKSDIDVVVEVVDLAGLRSAIRALQSSDSGAGPRVDGEITTARGDAVPWRELLGPPKEFLVKHIDGPRISSREQWLASLGQPQ